jgi:hypothetical protein
MEAIYSLKKRQKNPSNHSLGGFQTDQFNAVVYRMLVVILTEHSNL